MISSLDYISIWTWKTQLFVRHLNATPNEKMGPAYNGSTTLLIQLQQKASHTVATLQQRSHLG